MIWLQDEPRVGVVAVVETPRGPVTVATTHLSFVPGRNGAQLRTLTAAMARLPGPRVLLGDFNLPGSAARAADPVAGAGAHADLPGAGAARAARPRPRLRRAAARRRPRELPSAAAGLATTAHWSVQLRD